MSYFADLTPYAYIRSLANAKELNVGWLSRWHSFPKGSVSNEVLTKVFLLCKSPVNKTKGFHTCEFCRGNAWGVPVERDGTHLTLGSAEIRVTGRSGIQYACPDMIYHYMKDHQYKPPQEFIDAVLDIAVDQN